MDCVFLAQEITYDLNRKSSGGNVILKLDMMKAYDHLEWNFLFSVLRRPMTGGFILLKGCFRTAGSHLFSMELSLDIFTPLEVCVRGTP